MSFLSSIGKKRQHTPDQLVGSWREAVVSIIRQHSLATTEEGSTSLHACTFGEASIVGSVSGSSISIDWDKINKSLTAIKGLLSRSTGDNNGDCISDQERAVEVSRIIQSEMVFPLCISPACMLHLPLEARKDVATVFNHLLRRNVGNFLEYLSGNTCIIDLLMDSFSQPYGLTCAPMLREVIRIELFSRYVLFSEGIWRFFEQYVLLPHFEVAAAAFDLVRELLHTNRSTPSPATHFMEVHKHKLIDKFNVRTLKQHSIYSVPSLSTVTSRRCICRSS